MVDKKVSEEISCPQPLQAGDMIRCVRSTTNYRTTFQHVYNFVASLLSSVAVSGAYSDLSGKPTLGSAAAADIGTGAGEVAAGDHNHDAAYSAITHNHDLSYAALSHNHDVSYEALGAVAAHEAASDPHTGYQKESEKAQASGYASLDGSTKVPFAQLPTGTGASEVAVGNHTHPGGSEAFPIGAVFIAVVSTNPATLLGYGTWSTFAAGRMLVGLDSGDTDFDVVEETGGAKTHTLVTSEMPSHTHTQDSHNHTQDSHNHTQNSHNHTQDAHSHVQNLPSSQTGGQASGTRDTSTNGSVADALSTATATATNQAATATNQAATATNQAATATNQNTGGDGAHNNMPPYIVVYMWKRTA